jgi:hypothetical protein
MVKYGVSLGLTESNHMHIMNKLNDRSIREIWCVSDHLSHECKTDILEMWKISFPNHTVLDKVNVLRRLSECTLESSQKIDEMDLSYERSWS